MRFSLSNPFAPSSDKGVEYPGPPGGDPAFWMPDAATIARYQEADLILLNGAGYAGWVSRATLPPGKLVDTSQTFSDRLIRGEGNVAHLGGHVAIQG